MKAVNKGVVILQEQIRKSSVKYLGNWEFVCLSPVFYSSVPNIWRSHPNRIHLFKLSKNGAIILQSLCPSELKL